MYAEGRAYAKLNLTLDVTGLRPDGYHEMDMLMQTVDLWDSVSVETETGRSWSLTAVPAPVHAGSELPEGPENLAWKAAEAFYAAAGLPDRGLQIRIEKRIPIQAGMAGGSSDAAAVLRLLNVCHGRPFSPQELCRIGETVGSDVPYCVLGGTMRATGRGEQLERLPPLQDCRFVLCRPDFAVSTPAMFRALDAAGIQEHPDTAAALAALRNSDLPALGARMRNVFEPIALSFWPQAVQARQLLQDCGALGCCMTGTGSVFFGLFADSASAGAAAAVLRTCFPDVWTAAPADSVLCAAVDRAESRSC